MTNQEDLESLIRRYIILGKRSPKGYETVKCAKCNDYKVRGGFKFENGGVHYSCFNCSTSAGYDPSISRHSISKKFKEVLLAFGIPEGEIDRVVSLNFFKSNSSEKPDGFVEPKRTGLELPIKEVPLPKSSVLVSSGDSPWCEVAEEYLRGRGLKSSDFPFYVTEDVSYVGRLLIPYFFRERVIYWQGRSMDDDTISPRYKNPTVEKENIFFNMDEVYRYTNDPLFVCEGPLDSVSIGKNAVALLGSTLTDFKRNELRKAASRRRVVFVIDKNLNGYKLGQEVLEHGWDVTVFPDNVDDANDALQKYGKLWIAQHLASTAKSGFGGKLLLEMYCSV